MKPAPMTNEQIHDIAMGHYWDASTTFGDLRLSIEEAISVRDAQWEQMLNKTQDLYTSKQPVQNSHEFIHDPAEIRRVFEIDEADYPPPESGFAKL